MAGFGGAVKLTGESEYRKALTQITQNLREVSSEMKAVSASYSSNDKSTEAITAKTEALNKVMSEQEKKLSTLKAQYSDFSAKAAEQAENHDILKRAYENSKAKLDEIGRTLGTTSKEYQFQKQVVDELGDELRKSTAAQDANEKSMSKMRVEINNAQADCNKTARELENLGNEAEEAGRDAASAGDGFTVFKGVLADLASSAIQAAIQGIKELGGAIVDIGKQSISSFAEYEQLVGGVETLFGDSSDQLIKYAETAYKTAGLSANEYMETATSFSASLLQGLGGDTEKAVEYANMAIVDMSDNANKMGTDMTMIQNAYQGFAKDNYTMLDNLKLGYGGTQAEMARLINDSGVLGDSIEVTAESVKDVPFDKIIEAIHKTQEEIGITGTTTAEAEKTISGSAKSMKAAWENLLVGLANGDADISPLLDDLVHQVIVAGQNLIPRVKEVIHGMIDLVKEVWNEVIPELAKEFPELQPLVDAMNWVKENADYIIAAIAGIGAAFAALKIAAGVTSAISAFKTLFTTIKGGTGIVQALALAFNVTPVGLIIAGIAALVATFAVLWTRCEGFREFWINLWENIKTAFSTAWDAVINFFTVTIPEAFDSVLSKIGEWKDNVVSFFQSLPEKAAEVVQGISNWFQQLPYYIGYAVGLALGKLILWGTNAVNWVKTEVPKIIDNIVNFFKELPSKIWNWLKTAYLKVVQWGKDTVKKAKESGKDFVENVVNFIKELPSKVQTWLTNTINNAAQFALDLGAKATEAASNMFNNIVEGIKGLPDEIKTIGSNIVSGLWNGINEMKDWVIEKIKGFGSGLVHGLKNALGIASPSKVFRDQVGKNIALGIGEGFMDEMAIVSREMQGAIPTDFDMNVTSGAQRASAVSGYDAMVAAFKDALSQMKIELDDDEVGRFIDKTVTRLVYT